MATVVLRERDQMSWTWEACIVEEDLEEIDDDSANRLTVRVSCGHAHQVDSKRAIACVRRLERILWGAR